MNVKNFYPIYQKCNSVQIDSRKLKINDVFFAFSGDTYNAAIQAEWAIDNGALAVIVEQIEYENIEKNIFYVPSTLHFLQDLAQFHRSQLDIPIIGLTGSNGKTTTKEIIHAVLSQKYNVQSTIGNFNNHIGVPLTLLSITSKHEIAVVEMGANHQKEIEFLCDIAKPTIGYITNFGKAHLEGFGGYEGVIKGKSELYNFLINCNGDILVNETDAIQIEKTKDYSRKITFGLENSNYHFENFNINNFVGLIYKTHNIQSQLTGNYNFSNLSAAAALGLFFNIDVISIKTAIENYQPTNMRSQIVQKNGVTLVLDTYNANPSSMKESLQNFITFSGTKTIIIGDMLELGIETEVEHKNILKLALELNFEQILTVGKHFKNVNHLETSFLNIDELIAFLKEHKITSENILLKGSRGIALEKIIDFL